MKSIKMALLGGAALAVTAAGAQADDLDALKAQIEALNARVAAMETAPAIPAGYQLLTISETELTQTPGMEMTPAERFNYGNKATRISVLPTADAPAGATIDWSGYARAALVYRTTDATLTGDEFNADSGNWERSFRDNVDDLDDLDVFARGAIRVKASTDTAVGEVGVDIRIRAETYDGVEDEYSAGFAMDVAWGYWAMTPELTFGGGYTGTLGNIAYGFDGGCTCMYIDTLGLDPGDTSQMRLTYASGPFSMAVALEDASLNAGLFNTGDDIYGLDDSRVLDNASSDQLGVAGEIKYSGDMFSGEISGMWRGLDDSGLGTFDVEGEVYNVGDFLSDGWWQVGAGVGFGLGEWASLSLAAAIGEGPVASVDDQYDTTFYFPWNNSWWAVSGVASFNVSDEVHAEIGAGYKQRDFDNVDDIDGEGQLSGDSDYWVVGGGLYYNPVDQLTIGVEASYSQLNIDVKEDDTNDWYDDRYNLDADSVVVDLVSVWRF